MNTENLPDMIQEVPIIPQVIDHPPDNLEVNANNYQPETEEALIEYVNNQNSKLEMASILVKWEIGRSINSFYKGKYGDHELEKISTSTGMGTNNLRKMCRFARIYTAEQLQSLLKGNYTLTWFDIAQNLAVEPAKMIQTYELSESYDNLLIQIKRLKDPDEKRGKSRSTSIAIAETVVDLSTTIGETETPVLNETLLENPDITVIQIPDGQVKEMDDLRVEIKKLREDLEHREYQVNQLQELYHDTALEMHSKNKLIENLRATLKQVYGMIENGYDHVNMLSQVDWHI